MGVLVLQHEPDTVEQQREQMNVRKGMKRGTG